jgi:hypothetical protein
MLIPCLTPSDKSQSSPFQHCPLTSTRVLRVFVKRDKSACAAEDGDSERAGSREEKGGTIDGIRTRLGAEGKGDEVEYMRRAGGRRK